MPLAFPSHQGLILPLWTRFPRHIDGLALCVGAAMPDVVDGAAWPLRGELGQWLGHSLIGLPLTCVPAGLLIAWGLRAVATRGPAPTRGAWSAVRRGLARLAARPVDPSPLARRWVHPALSVLLGAASHVFFDLLSHEGVLLLWPWRVFRRAFPEWWYRAWGHVPLGVYKEPYPLAAHTAAWLVLSALGAYLFVRALRRGCDQESCGERNTTR